MPHLDDEKAKNDTAGMLALVLHRKQMRRTLQRAAARGATAETRDAWVNALPENMYASKQ